MNCFFIYKLKYIKKGLLLILFQCIVFIAFSQNDSIDLKIKYISTSIKLYNEKKYQDAKELLVKINLNEFSQDSISNSIFFLKIYYQGLIHYQLKEDALCYESLLKAFSICKLIYTKENKIYSTCIEWLISISNRLNKINEKKKYIIDWLHLQDEINAIKDIYYAANLEDLGNIFREENDFKNAEINFLQALNVRKLNKSFNDKDYSISLNNLASLYTLTGEYNKAEILYLESISIVEEVNDSLNLEICYPLINLADFYVVTSKFSKADSLYKKAFIIEEKLKGKIHPDFLLLINHYANYFVATSEYDKALNLYRNNLVVIEAKIGTVNLEYLSCLKGLSNVYTEISDFFEAEKVSNQALVLSRKLFGIENYRNATILFELGNINYSKSNYFTSDSLYNEALLLYKNTFGERHPAYLQVKIKLADIYMEFGEYNKAKTIFEDILTIENDLQRDSSALANILGRIGIYYFNVKDLYKANKFLNESYEILKRIKKTNTTDYAYNLENLATLYDKLGDFKNALIFSNMAIKVFNNTIGINTLGYLGALNVQAVIYFHLGNIQMAINILNEAIDIQNNNKNININLVQYLILNLTKIYHSAEKYDSSLNLFNKNMNILNNNILSQISDLTPLQQEKYLYTVTSKLHFLKSILFNSELMRNKITGMIYDEELINKNLILRNTQLIQNAIINSNDTSLINAFYNLKGIKNKLSKIYSNPILESENNLMQLEVKAESLEKKIALGSKTYLNLKKQFSITWKDVQNKLLKEEVAIELISFNYYNKGMTDSILYGALVLRPEYTEPKFVYLFEQKQLEQLLQKQNTNGFESSFYNYLYSNSNQCNGLTKLIWNPLDSLLKNVKSIYIASSGLIHNINIASLPLNDSVRIGQQYQLHILGTTGDIVNKHDQYITDSTINKAFIFGGINYDTATNTFAKSKKDNSSGYNLVVNEIKRGAVKSWKFLLNTIFESSTIDSLCRNKNILTEYISGIDASETSFKNISGYSSNYILHLATHGYFFPDLKMKYEKSTILDLTNDQNIFKVSENPLLRSGLIFSGANKRWGKPNYQSNNSDDGILTAYEVSNLDLRGAKLVIMSACETGLGDIKGSEGVFGLQRSFKLAGAGNIIMSLWKVPDVQTKELMQSFYQYCFKGNSVYEAFKMAQGMMDKKYPNSPYYWAAFKLLE